MTQFSRLSKVSLLSLVFILLATGIAKATPVDFTGLVKSASPAVVNISTERTEETRGGLPGFGLFPNMPGFERYNEFFEEFHRNIPPQSRKRTSLGSGFIISADGFIVTNNHVVEGADLIKVAMEQQKKEKVYTTKVIGTDPDTDLALLKIDAKNLPTLNFGDSDALEVGEWVLAIGNPLGFDHSVTAGILSAKGRNIQAGTYDDFLQTDASINPGNSGGPLLNMKGEVVGINTAIASRAQGIGFAIPSTMAKKIIQDLREHRKVSRGWLGVTIQNVDEAAAKALGLKKAEGVLIGNVLEGQPADKAGIKAGDVIISIDDEAMLDSDQLLRKVALVNPGTKIKVGLWRDGKEMVLDVVVSERDSQQSLSQKGMESEKGTASAKLGITVRPITATDVSRFKLTSSNGLIITEVDAEGLAAKAGIRTNDVVLAVNRKAVNSTSELVDAINQSAKQKGALLLHISRGGNVFFIGVDIIDD